MRTKKAFLNSGMNVICFLITFLPNIILRSVFLNELGSSLLGLNSLYSNIINWLSIAEMGIGSAIVYSLYKPFKENDESKIKAYIRFYGEFYKKTGILVLVIGLILAPFIKFFIGSEINYSMAILIFILFLLNSFISYMFSHRLCILTVAQEGYKLTFSTTSSKLIIMLIQIIILKYTKSFVLYTLIQLLINLIYYIGVNMYIKKKYKWLCILNEELDINDKRKLLKNVKAMFIHKIGYLMVFSTDNLIISRFVGLSTLGKYTNYQMIINAIQAVITNIFNGLTASIGNLIAEDNKEKSYEIHKKVFFFNFWIVSFVVISLYNTLNQFVVIWVGIENKLDELTFAVILVNLYFTLMRGSVTRFQEGAGVYQQDKFAAFAEAFINLISSLILVNYLGLAGVFIGTLISNITVIFWTKPYVVYKYVFKEKLSKYYVIYFKYLIIGIIMFLITNFITHGIKNNYDIISFLSNCIINILVINLGYIIIFFRSEEMKYFIKLLRKRS